MFWVLLITLFHADPATAPDTVAHGFLTEQACGAAAKADMAVLQKGNAGYQSVRMTCLPQSNPATERGS